MLLNFVSVCLLGVLSSTSVLILQDALLYLVSNAFFMLVCVVCVYDAL